MASPSSPPSLAVDPNNLPPAISARALADLLQKSPEGGNKDKDVCILDGSWFMPNAGRDGRAEFLRGPRIPTSAFFDVAGVCDRETDLPHMLPTAAAFAAAADRLGIRGLETPVVVFDRAGVFSAPRVWWTFRVFGHRNVSVLDGGLPAWQRAGLPLEEGPASAEAADAPAEAAAAAAAAGARSSPAASYPAALQRHLLRDLRQVRELVAGGCEAAALVDARGAARFSGAAPEPRPGLPSGSIPGSSNCPYDSLLDGETKALKDPAEVRSILGRAGFGAAAPEGAGGAVGARGAVATCGTGVTASVLAWACAASGLRGDVAVYDGSWSEWGSLEDTPKATGGGVKNA